MREPVFRDRNTADVSTEWAWYCVRCRFMLDPELAKVSSVCADCAEQERNKKKRKVKVKK